MARTPRMEAPGAWHHVMNRGADHQDIFRDDRDRLEFVELLRRGIDEFGIECHGFCLMGNHFHLLVRTPEPNLGEVMQLLLATYTRRFNRRHTRDGPLFRGRFKSLLVDSDRYLLGVSRYIHRNPIEAGLVTHLADYRWSSFRSFAGLRPRPPWLEVDFTLDAHGGGPEGYRSFVETMIPSDSMAKFYARKRLPSTVDLPEAA